MASHSRFFHWHWWFSIVFCKFTRGYHQRMILGSMASRRHDEPIDGTWMKCQHQKPLNQSSETAGVPWQAHPVVHILVSGPPWAPDISRPTRPRAIRSMKPSVTSTRRGAVEAALSIKSMGTMERAKLEKSWAVSTMSTLWETNITMENPRTEWRFW